MQKNYKTIGTLTAVSALAIGNVLAGPAPSYTEPAPVENAIDAEIHVGYSTKYLFRGIELGDDLAEAGIDVGTSLGGFDLSAGAWYGSWNANSPNPATGLTFDADELDIYTEVSRDLGFATLAVGYIYYHFPQGDVNTLPGVAPLDDAQEIYLSASRELFWGIDATVAYFWDIETDNDGYSQVSFSKGFEIMPYVTLNVGSDFGYLVEEGDFVHMTTKVGIDIEASENATISYYIGHVTALTEGGTLAGVSSPSTAIYTGQENELFAGASVAVSF